MGRLYRKVKLEWGFLGEGWGEQRVWEVFAEMGTGGLL